MTPKFSFFTSHVVVDWATVVEAFAPTNVVVDPWVVVLKERKNCSGGVIVRYGIDQLGP